MEKEGGNRVSRTGVRIGGVTTSQPSYVLWRSPDMLLRIEFPAPLLEEIRAESLRTAHALRGSGVEFGGILLGSRVGDLVRVLAWVPIECRHAFGPAFVLSAQDEESLTAQLHDLRRRSPGPGLLPVGWFVTNLQGLAEPSESHLRIHSAHFAGSGGILLLCQPELSGNVRLHVSGSRAADRALRTYANPLVLEPAHYRSPNAPPGAESPARYSRTARWTRERTSQAPPAPHEASAPARRAYRILSARARTWTATGLLSASTLLLFFAGAVLLWNHGPFIGRWAADRTGLSRWFTISSLGPRPNPLRLPSLHAVYSKGSLTLAWDAAGMRLSNALDGSLEIRDRSRVARYPLPASGLASGRWTIPTGARPASARLRYRTAAGVLCEESVRFLPPGAARR